MAGIGMIIHFTFETVPLHGPQSNKVRMFVHFFIELHLYILCPAFIIMEINPSALVH